jgi:hypothetical protein
MATSDTNLPGQGDGLTGLSVDDVTKIITAAKTAGTDPVTAAVQLFSGLDDKATVSGSNLREALSTAAIPIAAPLDALLSAIQDITKTGDRVEVTNGQEVHMVLDGTPVRLKNEVSFGVAEQDGLPAFQNIVGVSVHKLFWIDIQTIQLIQNQGQKVIRVETSHGSKDIPLG